MADTVSETITTINQCFKWTQETESNNNEVHVMKHALIPKSSKKLGTVAITAEAWYSKVLECTHKNEFHKEKTTIIGLIEKIQWGQSTSHHLPTMKIIMTREEIKYLDPWNELTTVVWMNI